MGQGEKVGKTWKVTRRIRHLRKCDSSLYITRVRMIVRFPAGGFLTFSEFTMRFGKFSWFYIEQKQF